MLTQGILVGAVEPLITPQTVSPMSGVRLINQIGLAQWRFLPCSAVHLRFRAVSACGATMKLAKENPSRTFSDPRDLNGARLRHQHGRYVETNLAR